MTSPDSAHPLLLLDGLQASADGRVALDGVTLTVARGEIHAVVGNQGAGKSTLVKVIAGLLPKTGGRFLYDGRPVERHSAGNAQRLGILTLHQEPGLLQGLSAVENVFMNREIRKLLFFNDRRRMREQLAEAFRTIHLDVDPERPIRHFDSAVQQLIEIAKLACFPSQLVVVDEPASRLRPDDIEKLQYLLSVLRQNGTTILYVTSSMEEVFHFASRLTVLERGRVIETSEISSMDENQLVQLTYAQLFSRRKLEKSNLEMAYLNNLNRNIINNIPIPIVVADSRGSIILVNRCLESLAKVPPAGLPHTEILAFLKLPAGQAEALARDIAARRHHEIRGWRLATGAGPAPVDLHVYPILDDDQSFAGTIYLLDMKESHELFAAQMELFDSYQQNRRAIWEIVHEINNPLGIMLNYLTLIRSSSSIGEIHANAEVMGRELKRVRRIFSRLAGTRPETRRQESRASLRDVVGEVLTLLKLNMNERVSLTLSMEDEISVPIEPDVLKQVILNLVLNGIEAMPDGGSLAIHQGCVTRDGARFATLTVHDTGIGIPPENLQRVFDPFFTTKSDDEARGLGLSLSKDIVLKAGGVIEVHSAPGGTSFTVFIPSAGPACTSG
jgi:signal transduction histidine kinase/ABC-type branched-subunit amino acid transport system ATPase component